MRSKFHIVAHTFYCYQDLFFLFYLLLVCDIGTISIPDFADQRHSIGYMSTKCVSGAADEAEADAALDSIVLEEVSVKDSKEEVHASVLVSCSPLPCISCLNTHIRSIFENSHRLSHALKDACNK
jgi:hypothetical protein